MWCLCWIPRVRDTHIFVAPTGNRNVHYFVTHFRKFLSKHDRAKLNATKKPGPKRIYITDQEAFPDEPRLKRQRNQVIEPQSHSIHLKYKMEWTKGAVEGDFHKHVKELKQWMKSLGCSSEDIDATQFWVWKGTVNFGFNPPNSFVEMLGRRRAMEGHIDPRLANMTFVSVRPEINIRINTTIGQLYGGQSEPEHLEYVPNPDAPLPSSSSHETPVPAPRSGGPVQRPEEPWYKFANISRRRKTQRETDNSNRQCPFCRWNFPIKRARDGTEIDKMKGKRFG